MTGQVVPPFLPSPSRGHRLAALIGLCTLTPAMGQAQSAGNGIKVGEGRLHPFLETELRLDTAAGFFRGRGPVATLQPELIFHLKPGARLELSGANVDVNANAYLDWVQYTGFLTPNSNTASRLDL